MKWRFKVVDHLQLNPMITQLKQIEAEISYPIDGGNDAFYIDHGHDYHSFFSTMGKVRFILAYVDDELVGSIAGVWKKPGLVLLKRWVYTLLI